MKKILFIATICFGLLTINACKKSEPPAPPQPTSLELNLKDALGNPVSGASVELYSSLIDWNNSTNQVGSTQISSASGKVSFTNLQSINYYFHAEKGCTDNVNGATNTASPLTANIINVSTIVLSSTGTLKFINTSSNPYRVYINGTIAFDMNGGTTASVDYKPIGLYTLRVLQLSGYLISPTDRTYTGTLSCGATLQTTFP